MQQDIQCVRYYVNNGQARVGLEQVRNMVCMALLHRKTFIYNNSNLI